MPDLTINTDNLKNKAPVYSKYNSQFNPQPAFIQLDCRDGSLMADYSGEIGNAVPMYFWHNQAVRWDIPSETSGESIKEVFESEDFQVCCQRILDGYEDYWDGSNWRGRYSEDAQAASQEVERILENRLETIEVWETSEWLFQGSTLKEHWCDQPLDEAVSELEGCIEDHLVLLGSIEDALVDQANDLFAYHPDDLTQTHVAELLEREKITQNEYNDWMTRSIDANR